MNTVSLCMIVKNEKSNIETLMLQVCPVFEQVVVVDTGSTDGTLEILSKLQETYKNLEVHHFEWIKDFSAARNFSYSKATQDWIVWVDGDDTVNSVEELIKFKNTVLDNSDVDCWTLDYIYSRYPDGKPAVVLGRERFIRRSKNPKWNDAIHETISIWGMRTRHYLPLKIIHDRNGKVIDYNRNVEILESEYVKRPQHARTAYYLGKELFDRINPRGIEILNKYLTIDGRYWDDEINARFRLACDDIVKGRYTEALNHAEKIYHLDGSRLRAEGYWVFGMVEYKLQNYKVATRWFERCLDGEPGDARVINREYYTWNPMLRLVECYWELKDFNNMYKYLDMLIDTRPDEESFRQLEKKNRVTLDPKGGLRVIEVGTKVRNDSYTLDCPPRRIPLENGDLDGIVAKKYSPEFSRVIKPKGFLWLTELGGDVDLKEFNYLGEANYLGTRVHNFVRIDHTLPSYVVVDGDRDFGPYRIRLDLLKESLKKNGFRVNNGPADVFVRQNLRNKEPGCVNVLDICEWLPDSDYKQYGIQHADVVVCSSPLLTELMQNKFPQMKVECVEDHVEFNVQEWL